MRKSILVLLTLLLGYSCATTANREELTAYRDKQFYLNSVEIQNYPDTDGLKIKVPDQKRLEKVLMSLPLEEIALFYDKKYGIKLDYSTFKAARESDGYLSMHNGLSSPSWKDADPLHQKNGVIVRINFKFCLSSDLSGAGFKTMATPRAVYSLVLKGDGKKIAVERSDYSYEPSCSKPVVEDMEPVRTDWDLSHETLSDALDDYLARKICRDYLVSYLETESGESLKIETVGSADGEVSAEIQ